MASIEKTYDLLTQNEEAELSIIKDPIKWSEASLRDPRNSFKPFRLRKYQKKMLAYQAEWAIGKGGNKVLKNRIKVYRTGRRLGKCLDGDTRIVQDDGHVYTVKEMYQHQYGSCFSINDRFKIKPTHKVSIKENGVKDIYRMRTKTGREIDVTLNHPFLTLDGWKDLGKLKIGDYIIVPSKINVRPRGKKLDDKLIKILGYLLGDGGLTTGLINFTNVNELVCSDFVESCTYFEDIKVKTIKNSNRCLLLQASAMKVGKSNSIKKFLREHGITRNGSHTKFIPQVVFKLSKKDIALFLSRLFACDGSYTIQHKIHNGRKIPNVHIDYSSVSKDLIYGIMHLLLRFGIKSQIRKKITKLNGKLFSSYILEILSTDDMLIFIDEINMFSKEDTAKRVKEILLQRKCNDNGYYNLVPKDIYRKFGIKDHSCDIRLHYRSCKRKILRWAIKYKNQYLIDLCKSETIFDRIKSIQYLKKDMTYDLTVYPDHNFIANDMFVHNTVIIAVEALWFAFTNVNFKVLICTPYESQLRIIFNFMDKLMMGSSIKWTRYVKKPFIMGFGNGSEITGATLGAKSASKGAGSRGEAFDLGLLDEMDHGLDDVITEIILPIFFNNPRATIIASSTPSGRRGLFYNWCNDSDIKEFHFASSISPNWTAEAEAFARKSLTKTQYTHEVMANWGDVEEGVFRNQDLLKISKSYHYFDVVIDGKNIPGLKYNKNNLYIMGVDWNETYGAAIIIIERLHDSGRFRIFRNIRVEKSEFTQLQSVQKVIDLATSMNFLAIYVDKGFGSMQIETIRKYGKDHPQTKLDKIAKAIEYGGNLEIRSPVSGKKETKPAKPYMVNNAVIVVENHLISIPKDEDEQDGLIGQMRNFKVAKFSRGSDRPVYDGGNNDHALNAMFLALLGFNLELDMKRKKRSFAIARKVNAYNIPKTIMSRDLLFDDSVTKFRRLLSSTMPNYLAKRNSSMKKYQVPLKAKMSRRDRVLAPRRKTF